MCVCVESYSTRAQFVLGRITCQMWGSDQQPMGVGLPSLFLVSATCILALLQPLLLQGVLAFAMHG